MTYLDPDTVPDLNLMAIENAPGAFGIPERTPSLLPVSDLGRPSKSKTGLSRPRTLNLTL